MILYVQEVDVVVGVRPWNSHASSSATRTCGVVKAQNCRSAMFPSLCIVQYLFACHFTSLPLYLFLRKAEYFWNAVSKTWSSFSATLYNKIWDTLRRQRIALIVALSTPVMMMQHVYPVRSGGRDHVAQRSNWNTVVACVLSCKRFPSNYGIHAMMIRTIYKLQDSVHHLRGGLRIMPTDTGTYFMCDLMTIINTDHFCKS